MVEVYTVKGKQGIANGSSTLYFDGTQWNVSADCQPLEVGKMYTVVNSGLPLEVRVC